MPTHKNIIASILVLILQHAPDALQVTHASASSLAWAAEEGPVSSATTTVQHGPLASPASLATPSVPGPLPHAAAPQQQEHAKPEPGIVDVMQGGISRGFLASAEWLDSFFVDERSVQEENKSYMRLRYDIFKEERADTTHKPAIDVRLVLPQLQKKTRLVLSAEPSRAAANSPGVVSTAGDKTMSSQESNVTTAVHYFFRSTPQESTILRTGAQISHNKPVFFLAPRYRALFAGNPWSFRFTEEMTWRSDTKWLSETTLDLERTLFHDLFFRTTADGVWTQGTNGYPYTLSATLRQPINPTNAVEYALVNTLATRPNYVLSEVGFKITYRHSFWRDWLFFELTPQIRYPRDKAFIAVPGVQLRLEMFFGKVQ